VPSLPATATAAGVTAAATLGALVVWRLARRPHPQPVQTRSLWPRRA